MSDETLQAVHHLRSIRFGTGDDAERVDGRVVRRAVACRDTEGIEVFRNARPADESLRDESEGATHRAAHL